MKQSEKIIVQLASSERKYVKVYHDFLDNSLLSAEEQIIFIVLKSFIDFREDSGEAFPSMETICRRAKMSEKRARKNINALIKKGIAKKIQRGLTKTNLYTLSDYATMWACDNVEDMAAVADNGGIEPLTPEQHIEALERMGYKVIKEEGPVSPTNQSEEASTPTLQDYSADTDNSTSKTKSQASGRYMEENFEKTSLETSKEQKIQSPKEEEIQAYERYTMEDSEKTSLEASKEEKIQTPKEQETQTSERYTMEDIRDLYEYESLNLEYPEKHTDIDVVFDILYDTLNSTRKTIRIGGEDKPLMVVIGRLMKLQPDDIICSIEKYHEQTGRIRNVKGYLLTILYNVRNQQYLDLMNLGHHNGDF